MTIRLEYVGIGDAPPCEITGKRFTWRVWREPRVSGSYWSSELKKEVRTTGPEWVFEDDSGYLRYIGETWAVAVQTLKGYVDSYGMKLLQELS